MYVCAYKWVLISTTHKNYWRVTLVGINENKSYMYRFISSKTTHLHTHMYTHIHLQYTCTHIHMHARVNTYTFAKNGRIKSQLHKEQIAYTENNVYRGIEINTASFFANTELDTVIAVAM